MIRTTQDSDLCLQTTGGWSSYSCKNSKDYCSTWQKDVYRCCPEVCGIKEPFTKSDCIRHGGKGICIYPFLVENERCNEIKGNDQSKHG